MQVLVLVLDLLRFEIRLVVELVSNWFWFWFYDTVLKSALSRKYTVNQGCMSLSPYYLEYGRHVARLRRRRPLVGFICFPI